MEDQEYNEYEQGDGGEALENQAVNKTTNSEKARRNYPTYNKGQKSEWIGMVHHQQEINDELAKIEREIRQLTAKTLNTEYERNKIAMFEKRRKELQQKQKEGEEMLEKRKLYEQDMSQFKQDKVMMQNHMNQVYNQLVHQKQEIMGKYKNEQLDIERRILEDNFRKLEQKQQELLEKKEREKNMAQSAIQEKEKIRLQQNFEQLQAKNEVNEMNKIAEMREVIKEENYKNFFKICADNQAYYQNLHRSQVLNPYMEKQDKISQIIEKNVREEKQRQNMKELERLRKQQEGNMLTKNVNEIQIQEKQKLKELEKMERQAQNEARLKDLQDYNNFLNYKKNQKSNQMNEYKQRLDTQFVEKKEKDQNVFRMTKNEKRLNYNDLQAFKEVDPSMYALIPGWSPQIGALKPVKQDPNNAAAIETQASTTKNAKFSPNIFSAKALVQNQFNKAPNQSNELPVSAKAEYQDQVANKASASGLLYGHNPILNPTPHNIQNPYLAKEFAQRKNFLSQMGHNSLF